MKSDKEFRLSLSHRARNIQASPIRRLVPLADKAEKRGIKVYHLNIGQPDIITPTEIMSAIKDYKQEVLSYGHSLGLMELRQELKKYYESINIPLALDDIMVTTGGSEAIIFALMSIGNPGDEVLIPEPFYTNYNGFATMANMTVVPVPTHVEDGYAFPPKSEFLKRITPKTRAILYCSPNNPTGAVTSRKELEMLVEIAQSNNLWILADEVYREFTYDHINHTSIFHIKGVEDRAIMIDSISKRFSACGARIGCIVSKNKDIMQALLKFGQARLCPPTLDQIGAIAAYRHIDKYIKKMIVEYEHRRDVVCEELHKIPGVVFKKPAGAFYLMPYLPVDDANKFTEWLLTDFSVDGATTMVAPADGFYATPGKGKQEIRIAYVLKEQDLRNALQILGKGIVAYNKSTK
jgi:aspartate aminotransferase